MKQQTKEKKRIHRATFASDKRNGGYLIRVVGPNSNAFAGCEVPVMLKNGEENLEKLEHLIWTGKDKESGESVTLYKFAARPKTVETETAEF